MRSKLAAAAVGALAAVTVAGTAQLAYEYLPRMEWGRRFQSLPPSPLEILLTTAFAAGPGAFILAFALSIPLRRQLEAKASRGRVLALGALGGLPAGLLNLFALMILLGGAREIPTFLAHSRGRMSVVAALAGGVALGLACAWSLTRRPREGAG